MIGFQLTVNYWFYPYVTWFEPFVFVSLLLATNEKTTLDSPQPSAVNDQQDEEGRDTDSSAPPRTGDDPGA